MNSRRMICVAALASSLLGVAACGDDAAVSSGYDGAAITYSTSAPQMAATDHRGQIVRAEKGLPEWTAALPAQARIQRIVYRSTSGVTGDAVAVSGAVFTPGGARPSGGWPLIAYAHGTTGITRDCAPSDRADMFGDLYTIRTLLSAGFAVVSTDYLGLGTRPDGAPPHPYMEPRSAGYAMVDAARAARRADPAIGTRWVSYGASQGGAAAWAAAEEYAGYGDASSTMIGAVAVVPFLNPADLVGRAQDGALTPAQRFLYPIVVAGAAQTDSSIDPSAYLHGIAEERRATLVSCSADRSVLSSRIRAAADTTFTAGDADAEALADLLGRFSLPRTQTDVPMLAVYGSADDIIGVDVMEVALGRGCELGLNLNRVRREGEGHSLDPGAMSVPWVKARFAGTRAVGNC